MYVYVYIYIYRLIEVNKHAMPGPMEQWKNLREAPRDTREVGASQPRLKKAMESCLSAASASIPTGRHPGTYRLLTWPPAGGRQKKHLESALRQCKRYTVSDVRPRPCLRKQRFANLVAGKHSTA